MVRTHEDYKTSIWMSFAAPLCRRTCAGLGPIGNEMNKVLERPADEAEPIEPWLGGIREFRRRNRRRSLAGHSAQRCWNGIARTMDSRRDDLEQTHWKKIWRSMQDD